MTAREPVEVTSRIRAALRRSGPLVTAYRGVRRRLGGPVKAPKPKAAPRRIEDRVAELRQVTFVPSPRPAYRLNLVVPAVDAARTFGGIRTALDLFAAIAPDVDERRIVAVGRPGPPAADVVEGYRSVESGQDPSDPRQLVVLRQPDEALAVRRNDVFIATFWTTAELIGRIRRWQTATHGSAPERFGYVVQDFEPGFYPFSAQWLLARATYAEPRDTVAVFNTAVLQSYFHDVGIRFDEEFVFEPRMLPTLREAMATPARARSRTIVVYGRPGTARNAFPAIVDGLRAWQARHPAVSDWRVISVGRTHPDIDLGDGLVMRSIGKLDLAAYASLLREAAIGVSLMVSPHPSYPPLEMAHLGMLVVTNRFAGKDLAAWHSNIRTTDDISAEGLASELSAATAAFERDPAIGSTGRPLRPDFLSDDPPFPMGADIAAALRRGVDPGEGLSAR